MPNYSLNLPINGLSLGQCSVGILREVFKRGHTPAILPLGNVDLGTQSNLTPEFHSWLQHCIGTAQQKHSRDNPVYRLWHLNGSLESYSNKGSRLITFFELNSPTPTEVNILRQQEKVYVTSKYTQGVFKTFGIESEYLPLGFDTANFGKLDKAIKIPGEISFLVGGKYEAMRKRHAKTIAGWVAKFGNKQGFKLNVAVHNPFLGRTVEEAAANTQNMVIQQAMGGKTYWNVNFIPYCPANSQFNEVLQSSDVYLAMAGGEGRDLVAYHAVAMGAHCVALNAHAYKDYLDDSNAVLVNPNSMIPCLDGIFFHPGQPFNQGNIFDWDDADYAVALDKVVERVKAGPNTKGLELQQLTYANTTDVLLKDLV